MAYQLRESMGKRDVHSMVYPPWTTEDDDHKKYDVTIMRQRSLRRRILQRGSETYSKALKGALPEMRISITGRQRRSEVESESDSAGDDEDSEDDEATDNVQDVTPDLTLEDKVPSLAAPSTDAKIEASGESAMVSSLTHESVHIRHHPSRPLHLHVPGYRNRWNTLRNSQSSYRCGSRR